ILEIILFYYQIQSMVTGNPKEFMKVKTGILFKKTLSEDQKSSPT
ncbi:uncharacterized protein METZ01_LOCUS284644, partial [marine metagenome]